MNSFSATGFSLIVMSATRGRVRRSVVSTKLQSTFYREQAPASVAGAHLACTWVGAIADDGNAYTDRVLPDACIDVIWDGQRVFVAGPDTGPVLLTPVPGTFHAGVRFQPGHAPAFLGTPASALLDQRVDVENLWGRSVAAQLQDRLSACSVDEAARVLEHHVATIDVEPDPWSAAAVSLALDHDVEEMAEELGITARTLHRRCVAAFGYGAKTLQRVLRFRRFLTLAESWSTARLGRLAADAGYADQSHLTRESNELAGLAPGALLINRGVRSVQDSGD
jgi:AraC-like DNA-binding protein